MNITISFEKISREKTKVKLKQELTQLPRKWSQLFTNAMKNESNLVKFPHEYVCFYLLGGLETMKRCFLYRELQRDGFTLNSSKDLMKAFRRVRNEFNDVFRQLRGDSWDHVRGYWKYCATGAIWSIWSSLISIGTSMIQWNCIETLFTSRRKLKTSLIEFLFFLRHNRHKFLYGLLNVAIFMNIIKLLLIILCKLTSRLCRRTVINHDR